MKKTINLARAMLHNSKCLGYAWQMTRGKYDYQNDNDLGLDLDAINGKMPYNKKVYVGGGYYFYVMRGLWGESHTATTLKMVAILLKECHSALFTLTPREQKRADKYWGQF